MSGEIKQFAIDRFELFPEFKAAYFLVIDRISRAPNKEILFLSKGAIRKIVGEKIKQESSLRFFITSLTTGEHRVLKEVYFYSPEGSKPSSQRKLDPEYVNKALVENKFYSPVTGDLDENFKCHIKIYYTPTEEVLNDL